MSHALKNCRECHWWIQVEDIGDTGECRRFPPTVVADYLPKKIKMNSGESKTVIDAVTTGRYGSFPMTTGSEWCGEWIEQRPSEREALQDDLIRSRKAVESFLKQHPGTLRRMAE